MSPIDWKARRRTDKLRIGTAPTLSDVDENGVHASWHALAERYRRIVGHACSVSLTEKGYDAMPCYTTSCSRTSYFQVTYLRGPTSEMAYYCKHCLKEQISNKQAGR